MEKTPRPSLKINEKIGLQCNLLNVRCNMFNTITILILMGTLIQCSNKRHATDVSKDNMDVSAKKLKITFEEMKLFDGGVNLNLTFKNESEFVIIFDNRFGGISITGVLLGLHESIDFYEHDFYGKVEGFRIREHMPKVEIEPNKNFSISLIIGKNDNALSKWRAINYNYKDLPRFVIFFTLASEDNLLVDDNFGGLVLKNSFILKTKESQRFVNQVDCFIFEEEKVFRRIHAPEE